ncbi:MAG: hypothetical protein ACFFEF_01255 [Candidatus Thorarchaeota archaeon]
MPSQNKNDSIADLEEKVDSLSAEITRISEFLEAIPSIAAKVDELREEVDGIKETIEGVDGKFENIITGTDLDTLDKKVDDISSKIEEVSESTTEIKKSKETEVLFKKVDDLLIAIKDVEEQIEDLGKSSAMDEKLDELKESISSLVTTVETLGGSDSNEVIGKKIDDLQQYVAGLSALEEKVDEMATAFSETKEIVGIIVRQLDDIERKYNKASEDITEAAELVRSVLEAGGVPANSTQTRTPSKGKTEEDEAVLEASAATVDELMSALLSKVRPQTEAQMMAKALEDVRDKLTGMIDGHTPIIFQFGKRARELKSYPPTATLNENDIARLNKEIRDWSAKLKKIASE